MRLLCALLLCSVASWASTDLESAKKEHDAERRFELAMNAANDALTQARALPAEGGSVDDLQQKMDTVTAGVELALKSLRDTGRPPRKLAKYYKRGEIRTRDMLRLLENLIQAIAFDSRPPAEKARDRLVVMHDEFLFGVMSGK